LFILELVPNYLASVAGKGHFFFFISEPLKHSLTLFLLGGGVKLPPPVVFLHNSKSIGLRLLKFSDFSYIPKALSLGLKPGLILTA